MYQGITVIEQFEKWNEWYSKERKIRLSELPLQLDYFQNMGVVLKSQETELIPKSKDHGIVKGEFLYPIKKYHPCGVKPANTEQTIALELLKDDTIPLVTILGAAGGGKNFLACAHMLHCLERGLTSKIVIAKSLTPVGREVGFLKGALEDKVVPWLGSFYDNFFKLGKSPFEIEHYIKNGRIEISPITFIQGRSISNAILCIDEIQNLDMNTIKQIITRAGENCKVIMLGDPSQRFERGTFNLEAFIDKGRESDLIGHINFLKSIRSPLAEWAVQNL